MVVVLLMDKLGAWCGLAGPVGTPVGAPNPRGGWLACVSSCQKGFMPFVLCLLGPHFLCLWVL